MNLKSSLYRALGAPRLLPARERARDLLGRSYGVRHRALSLVAPKRAAAGVLSVVVPVYNVEGYLETMLRSLLRQRYRALEVIIVDDGSTDQSNRIARRFRRADPRVRIIRQPNAGLGAARNTGARAATGEFLAFVDSDDTVDRHAYRYTIATLRRTGSDFAVMPYRRLVRDAEHPAGSWIYEAHAEERLGARLADDPSIQVNAVAWSKVYRTSFWREHGLSFPEGILYEDQPVSTRAYALADGFDVLTHPAINWRVRDDGSSISQAILRVRNTRDHLAVALDSLEFLATAGLTAERATRLTQLLTNDYSHMIPMLPDASDEEWDEFVVALRRLVKEAQDDPAIWDGVPARNKVAFSLIVEDRRADLTAFLLGGGWRGDLFETRARDGAIEVDFGALNEALGGVAPEARRLSESQSSLRSQTQQIRWLEDGRLEIRGHAVIDGLDPATHDIAIAGDLVLGDQTTPLDIAWAVDPLRTASFATPTTDATKAFFSLILDPDATITEPGDWRIELTLSAAGVSRRRRLHDRRPSGDAEARVLKDGTVLDAIPDHRGYLTLRATRPVVTVTGLRTHGDSIVISGVAAAEVTALALVRADDRFAIPSSIAKIRSGEHGFEVTMPKPTAATAHGRSALSQHVWRVEARSADGRWTAAIAAPAIPLRGEPSDAALRLQRRPNGSFLRRRLEPADPARTYFPGHAALLIERAYGADLQSVEIVDGALVARFTAAGVPAEGASAVLRSKKYALVSDALTPVDGGYLARFPLYVPMWGRAPHIIPTGNYRLRVEWSGGSTLPICSGSFAAQLPAAVELPDARLWMQRDTAGGLSLDVAPPLTQQERSRYWQRRMREVSAATVTERATRPAVFFRCLYGEVTGDSAAAIHHELRRRNSPLELIWSTRDHRVPIPEGGTRVLENSEEFYRAINTSKYVIVNVHQPDWFARGTEQVVIQTMHGYPFKLAGRRHWEATGLPPARVASFEARAAEWDYFLSPARYATPLLEEFLPKAGWPGQMLELGYPRNDVLLAPDAGRVRSRARAALGIAPDQTAVLYAPTYRDYLSLDEFRARPLASLDLRALAERFAGTHVLLVRGHVMNSRVGYAVTGRNVIDVTDHPSISDLTLASDAAILDYSSLRFDYALTGKPMIFYNPDRDRYFEGRPPMVPYAPTAPGPWVETFDEVAKRLADLEGVRREYADAVRTFREDYLELEDGKAAARLVDAVFVPRGDA
ncbi:CDP-glycerol glycerophosphotransferase family protein [Agromyces mediolanus]|uniref:bifunctional glycosyltransferase/CDP-glycerol:glycerophosphate glycerophosphotransferase n=1 Tax=Agromyces mediolanus TaxID=41986 RepID=UPI003838E1A7